MHKLTNSTQLLIAACFCAFVMSTVHYKRKFILCRSSDEVFLFSIDRLVKQLTCFEIHSDAKLSLMTEILHTSNIEEI